MFYQWLEVGLLIRSSPTPEPLVTLFKHKEALLRRQGAGCDASFFTFRANIYKSERNKIIAQTTGVIPLHRRYPRRGDPVFPQRRSSSGGMKKSWLAFRLVGFRDGFVGFNPFKSRGMVPIMAGKQLVSLHGGFSCAGKAPNIHPLKRPCAGDRK